MGSVPAVAEIAADIASRYGVGAGVRIDVTDFPTVRAAFEESWRTAPIDHVVHCAAAGSGKFGFPFTNLSPDDWRRSLDVNVLGMVNVAHAATPAMVVTGRGTFVFLASVAGQIGSQTDPPYSAAKAANINFAQCMAKDLARHGVRVAVTNVTNGTKNSATRKLKWTNATIPCVQGDDRTGRSGNFRSG